MATSVPTTQAKAFDNHPSHPRRGVLVRLFTAPDEFSVGIEKPEQVSGYFQGRNVVPCPQASAARNAPVCSKAALSAGMGMVCEGRGHRLYANASVSKQVSLFVSFWQREFAGEAVFSFA
jgi:hypothetical protein